MHRCTRINNKFSFVWVDGRGRCCAPIHLWLEECRFVLQVGSANSEQLFGSLPSCFSCIICCQQRAFWISVLQRWCVGAAMMLSPPWITPRDGSNCSRMLMNRSAVLVYLSSVFFSRRQSQGRGSVTCGVVCELCRLEVMDRDDQRQKKSKKWAATKMLLEWHRWTGLTFSVQAVQETPCVIAQRFGRASNREDQKQTRLPCRLGWLLR